MPAYGNVFQNGAAAGAFSLAPAGSKFLTVTGKWQVPSPFLVIDQYVRMCYSWIGIGEGDVDDTGVEPRSLIQLGVLSSASAGPNEFPELPPNNPLGYPAIEYKAFYRWVEPDLGVEGDHVQESNYFIYIDNFAINAGDTVQASICSFETGASLSITNISSSLFTSFVISRDNNLPIDGNCAGWAVGFSFRSGRQGAQGFGEYGTMAFSEIAAVTNKHVTVKPVNTISMDAYGTSAKGIVFGKYVVCESLAD